ncbi:MAG TPA: CNNM domain-containing protein [Candidatus Udaeobacter sp.]|jgi:CBS domain containing-hemolysin-like protein|nr:CNNM domain-containing protein [Candidatus Udaeobacter sp.]
MTAAIIIIVCCWIISFFFNGIESGLLSIDPVRLRQNVKRRVPAALRLNRLLKYPERLLATVLLVTNAADIVALLLLTSQLFRRCGYAGFLFALLIALPVYLFVLSVLPKSLFRRFPFRALVRLAGVLEFTSVLFSPLLEFGARVAKALLPGHAGKRGRVFAAREELKQITSESEREGALTSTERAMIHSVVDFRGSKIRDVMVPSAKVAALDSGASTQEALRLGASTGLDRLPLLAADGQPAGLVNVLDILLERNGTKPLSEYVRRIVTTTDDEPAYRIMQQLRAARLGLAAVVDRKNKFRGIVTIEDLVQRLVSTTDARP